MAKHKAATQVTIVQEEKSAFGVLVDRFWKPVAAAGVAGAGLIVFMQYSQAKETEAVASRWDALGEAMVVDFTGQLQGEAADLSAALEGLEGTPPGSWGLVALVKSHAEAREYDEALGVLAKVRAEGLPIFTEQLFPLGASGSPVTLADHLETTISLQRKWEEGRADLFGNPPLPEGSPTATIETAAGNIVVGLYQDEAPKHVENFLKLADEGYYEGTKFHRIIPGFMIQGGDPNTKEGEPDTWGQGGPEYKIDAEENSLHHFRGFLSAAKQPGDEQSSGSQFFITSSDAFHLDGQHVIYGRVLEGMDVVDEIVAGEIDPGAESRDRPLEPVVVTRITKAE